MSFVLSRRSPRLRGRAMLVGILLVSMIGVSLRTPPAAVAALSGTKTCLGPDGSSFATLTDTVLCDLTLNGTATDIPAGATITITALGNNYTFTGLSTCTATGGTCIILSVSSAVIVVQCVTTACTSLAIEDEALVITALVPDTIKQQVSVSNPAATQIFTASGFNIRPAGSTFFVATTGNDANNCQTVTQACATINRALEVARDKDTILVRAGTYAIQKTVKVAKLVTIQPDSSAKVVLKADPGVTVFEITAQGNSSANSHVIISGFYMGGNFKPGSFAPVITLLNDNFTEITTNVIGAEDLPINNGIVLSNSDHSNIHDNLIQGSTQFVFTPLLLVGKNLTGFGIVSIECFGQVSPGVSDSVTISNNLFTNSWLAGIWLCSDGAGEHSISGNTMRNNWRGIALKDVTDTTVSNNILTDNKSDGIILYGASLNNVISKNTVESHVGASAAAIRIGWIADPIVPLNNTVDTNNLVRDTIGIHVSGARTTVIKGNFIKISGARTAILVTPSTLLGDPGTQPYDTEINGGNTIVFIGACSPVIGCGLRLVGVTVPVFATDNDWGLRRPSDVEGVIWHQYDDPFLGLVSFMPFRNMRLDATPTPPGAAPGVGPGVGVPGAGPGGMPAPTSTPPPTGTPPASSSGTPITTTQLTEGCTQTTWPGANGVTVVDAALGIRPPEAQRTVTIWRKENGDWVGWGPESGSSVDVFSLRRGDQLLVCVSRNATWMIPTEIGGP